MESVLAILCAGLVGFVILLSYYDLSPRTGLYKITKRFYKPLERLRPVKRDAPFRRVGISAMNCTSRSCLSIATSDGSGQACHPDVVHVPGGFGSERWPYWMVCTPHPYENEYVENPAEIFVSHDGITWSIPKGLRKSCCCAP